MSNFVVSWRTALGRPRRSLRVRALHGRHAIRIIKDREPAAMQCVAVVEVA